ncbi:MAG: Uma2 family endonuclease [Nostoc sp. DedQUE12a]|nr:Uma2 family endonuclease [Nostoc sp. DedQUE12a]
MFVYLPNEATNVYEELETKLPVPEFAKDFSLTVEGLFSWLLE